MTNIPDGVRLISQWTVLPDDPMGLRKWLRDQARERGEDREAAAAEERIQADATDEIRRKRASKGA